MEKRMISFSPPDISDLEIQEVAEALRSGWITTGPRVKLLERRLAAYIETGDTTVDTEDNKEYYSNRVVCLNSATAAEELNLKILRYQARKGLKSLFRHIPSTATASACSLWCNCKVCGYPEGREIKQLTLLEIWTMISWRRAITEKTKAIIPVDLGGIVCDYDKILAIRN